VTAATGRCLSARTTLRRISAGYVAAMNTAAAGPADGTGSPVNVLARAALAGAATGARSFTGLAALTLATPPGSAAVGAAWFGSAWRKAAARRFGTDYAGAGIEDVVAMSLAWAATRV
jgi:hypothetical protein